MARLQKRAILPVLKSLRTVRAANVFNSVGVRLDKSAVFPRAVARSVRSVVTGNFSSLGLWSLRPPYLRAVS